MNLSKYTLFIPKDDSLVLLNYLSGAIDLVEKEETEEFKKRYKEDNWDGYHLADYMKERRYLFADKAEEEDFIQERYIEFMDEYDQTPIQLIFSTTYACNFSCEYCFQEEYSQNSRIVAPEVTDSFFAFINQKFIDETVRPYITLFGGEPLLPGKAKENILYFLRKAKEFNYSIAIVTNGYDLLSYVPEFKKIGIDIKEIQVTLDGDRDSHDSRRFTKPGIPTFDRIADGIDLALNSGYRINLRSILDRDNMNSLPSLASFAEKRGWLDRPSSLFQTTLGRNYELHTCQNSDSLYDRAQMWKDFYKLSLEHEVIRKYHKPQFHGMRYISEHGELPFPVFDGCPAGKKEWAFDLNGDIYGCTASVGVKKFKLGSFTNPDEPFNQEQIHQWATRDVLSIEKCKSCAVSLSCGGGCGVLAYNKNGNIQSPDCRPVESLVALGVEYYGIGSGDKN